MDKYQNRQKAGTILAKHLKSYANRQDVIVFGLPRGGVPVAYEIARALHVPLDVFIVRKLGVPGHEELAMGAIAMGGVTVFNQDILDELSIPQAAIDSVIHNEQAELARREKAYRGQRPFPKVEGKAVILVDDGIATGATMKAAIKALRQFKPASIIIAIPVAEKFTSEEIENLADEVICPLKPTLFYAVGAWYEEFQQTSDEEVFNLLHDS